MEVVDYYARPASYTAGGVNRTRQEWLAAVSGPSTDVIVLDARGGYTERLVDSQALRFETVRHIGTGRAGLIAPALAFRLRRADLLYLNEGWTLSNVWAALMARLARVPYVIMPHGVYERKIRATLRTIPGRNFIERLVLHGAQSVHVFFAGEVDEVHALAPHARCVVIPPGFDPRPLARVTRRADPYLSWLGRFDVRHKGIDVLLDAFATLSPDARPRLRMVGPDHGGGKAWTQARLRELGLERWISVEDALPEDAAVRFVDESNGFVHVPRWECLGRTVVDALLAARPVLITSTAQIAGDLRGAGAARVVELSREAIAAGLVELGAGGEGLDATGRLGRQWALDNLTWNSFVDRWHSQVAVVSSRSGREAAG